MLNSALPYCLMLDYIRTALAALVVAMAIGTATGDA